MKIDHQSAATAASTASASGVATNMVNGSIGSAADAEKAQEFQQHLKAEILDKGLMGWAKEQWIAKLEAKLRKEVMAEMDLTDAQLTSMEETLRRTIEQLIREQLEKKMQDSLAGGPAGNGMPGQGGDQSRKPTGVAAGGISGKPTLSLPALTLAQGWGA